MTDLQLTTNPAVEEVFDKYPQAVRPKIEKLRSLILESAEELEAVSKLEETLKWGEPSYLTKTGSTIRIDWKEKAPDQYAIYFKCTSKLVPSFRTAYEEVFSFEGNRAIVFQMEDKVPEKELKQCIKAGLMYHKVKHLLLLGL